VAEGLRLLKGYFFFLHFFFLALSAERFFFFLHFWPTAVPVPTPGCATPVPLRATVGAPVVVPVLSVPEAAPAAVGAKLTLIVQVESGGEVSVAGQLFVCEYPGLTEIAGVKFEPRIAQMSALAPQCCVTVTVCALLVVPTDWLPKFRVVGATVVVALAAPVDRTRVPAVRAPSRDSRINRDISYHSLSP
jgi:hypothetical protein